MYLPNGIPISDDSSDVLISDDVAGTDFNDPVPIAACKMDVVIVDR